MKERADSETEKLKEKPDIVMFRLRFLDNPHIEVDEKRKAIERWSAVGDDVLRMRSEGEARAAIEEMEAEREKRREKRRRRRGR